MKQLFTLFILLSFFQSFSQKNLCQIYKYGEHYGLSSVAKLDSVTDTRIKEDVIKWAAERFNLEDIHIYGKLIIIDIFENLKTKYLEGSINFRLIFEIRNNKIRYTINVNDYFTSSIDNTSEKLFFYEQCCLLEPKFNQKLKDAGRRVKRLEKIGKEIVEQINTRIIYYNLQIAAIPFTEKW